MAEGADLEAPTVRAGQERGSESPAIAVDTPPAARLSTRSSVRGRGFFQGVARLGIQAAEALHYAHELGVIHRDIKPANLLVDGRGTLWITDFGLAHCQSQAGLTMSGDLVGTLRYMSPEQALARRMLVDHRTDIYSLGATLYELLTGEPVFAGGDREELLQQIAFEEPRPLRRLNKAIPAELDAIVLKALEKNPGDRYATAQELAEDLKRHLNDEPIRARRPGARIRLTKWARRHKALVAGFVSAAVILLIALTVGAFWYSAQRLELNVQISDALNDARALMSKAEAGGREQAVLWAKAREAAGRAETLADSSLAKATLVKEVHELLQKLDDDEKDRRMLGWLEASLDTPSAVSSGAYSSWMGKQYATAFRKYGIDVENTTAQEASARIVQRGISSALVAALDDWASRTSDMPERERLMQIARAADRDDWRNQVRTAFLRKDRTALRALSSSAKVDALPAQTLLLLAQALGSVGEIARAADLLRRAQPAHTGNYLINAELGSCILVLRPRVPADAIPFFTAASALRPESAVAHTNLAGVLAETGQLDRAMAEYREALRLKPDYADAHGNLGNIFKAKGMLAEAVSEYHEAIRLDKDLPTPHSNLGGVLNMQGKVDEAIGELRQAIRLKQDFPEPHLLLGVALTAKGLLDEAIAEYEQVIALQQTYVAPAHQRLGEILERRGQHQAAISHQADAHRARADELHQKKEPSAAAAEYREALRLRPDDADTFSKLGFVMTDQGNWKAAAAAHREAIRLKPDKPEYHNYLGDMLLHDHDLAAAIVAFRTAIQLKPNFAAAHSNLGLALSGQGHLDEALAEYRLALQLDNDQPLPYFRMAHVFKLKNDFRASLDAVRRGLELSSFTPYWRDKSDQLIHMHTRLVELDDKLPAILEGKIQPADAAERIELAEICTFRHLPAATAQFYADAFAAQPDLLPDHRYQAARAAAFAGCGGGKDAANIEETRRADLRSEALRWLREELTVKQQENPPATLVQALRGWQGETAFAGVREPERLAKLPAMEQVAWRAFWADITRILGRGKGSP